MNLATLQTMIVKIKHQANAEGLTDEQVGQLEIKQILRGDKTKFHEVEFNLQLANLKGEGLFVLQEGASPIIKLRPN